MHKAQKFDKIFTSYKCCAIMNVKCIEILMLSMFVM